MSISISVKPEINVVNVGDEISESSIAAISNAVGAGASNPFATINDLDIFDQSLNTTDTVSFNSVKSTQYTVKDLNANLNFVVYNDTGAGTYYTSYFDAFTGKLNVPYGINVNDSFNGDQVNITGNSVVLQNYDGITNRILSVNAETGITFSDSSVQTTAYVESAIPKLSTANTFTGENTFEITGFGGNVPLTINNYSTGNCFVVKDAVSDATPFVINSAGLVGIGVASPTSALDVAGSCTITVSGTSRPFGVLNISTTSTADTVYIENRSLGNSFVVYDSSNPDSSKFVIGNNGDVGIGVNTVNTAYKLEVNGLTKTLNLNVVSGLTFNTNPAPITDIIASGATTVPTVAGTALTTGNYPQEIEIRIAGVNYRIPARVVA